MKDFSLDAYEELLEVMKGTGCPVLPVGEHLGRRRDRHPAFFILRHDVDRRPGRAMRMAAAESAHGVRATYYFRMQRGVFSAGIIGRIASMGHEIGYHYEVLDKAKGDFLLAGQIFAKELARMRSVADVETASMHGSPLSRRDNREFWTHYRPAQFGLRGDAYISMNEAGLVYLTDTGRGWNRAAFNLRDRLPSAQGSAMPPFRSTWDLMDAFRQKRFGKVYLQVHPNRWTSGPWEGFSQRVEDMGLNAAKWALSQARRRRILP